MSNATDSGSSFLRCFSKHQNCTSSDCEKIIECREAELTKNCYSITKNNVLNNNESTSSQKFPHVYQAGCWAGGEECRPPLDVLSKGGKVYELPLSLKDASIQDKCITYSTNHDTNGFWYRNNLSFCCCSTPLCNQHFFHSSERNPHEVHAQSLNPVITTKQQPDRNQYIDAIGNTYDMRILNTGLVAGLLTTFIIFFVLLSIFVLLF